MQRENELKMSENPNMWPRLSSGKGELHRKYIIISVAVKVVVKTDDWINKPTRLTLL